MSRAAVPEGYSSLTPYLMVQDGAKAIEFYTRAFGARERSRLSMPDGKVGHCEMVIGDSVLMLSDSVFGEPVSPSPAISLMLYVADVDAVVRDAVAAGGTLKSDVKDQFYGDRSGMVLDPFGHLWNIATRIEELSQQEVERRASEWAMKAAKAAS